MDLDAIKQNIQKFTESEKARMVAERKADEDSPSPTDVYQTTATQIARNQQREAGAGRGSSAKVARVVDQVINGAGTHSGITAQRKSAEKRIEQLTRGGETARANAVRNQYMQEVFLPAVEVVVNETSPDDLLNDQKALKALDAQALSGGARKMDGYTAAYVRSAYRDALGVWGGDGKQSDEQVADTVRRVNRLMDAGEASAARGLASRMVGRIDRGEGEASEDDYQLLSRVAR